jgi:hypothetical protein
MTGDKSIGDPKYPDFSSGGIFGLINVGKKALQFRVAGV